MFYLFYKLHIFLSKALLKLQNKSTMDPNYTGLVLRISLRVTQKDAWSKLLCVMDSACDIYHICHSKVFHVGGTQSMVGLNLV